jgi:Nucleolar RNA-binding protein, Nop10p family.
MRSDILVCTADEHDRPVYTLTEECPACGENGREQRASTVFTDRPVRQVSTFT